MHTGAVAFSIGLHSVLCVRKASSEGWQFPYLPAEEGDENSATAVVKTLTGLDISGRFTTDHVEAEVGLPQEVGSEMVRLFIAAGVPEDLPSSSEAGEEWEEVRWLPWQPLLSAGPHHLLGPHGQAPQRELIRPFLNLILKWHDRHKHVYQQEAVSEDAAQELGDIAVFRPSTWKGPLPRETLSHWCQLNQVADAYYTILDGQHPLFKSASCILSHRAAVITPEWAYSRAEDAMDNAALAAIMFLERGLNAATHRCKICTVGEVPQLGPLQYMARRGEFASLLASQSAALFAEKERVRQELEAQQASIEAQLNAVTQQQEVLNSQVFEEDAVLTADDVAATVEQLPSAVSLPVFNDAPPSQGKAKRQKTGKAAAKAAVAASNPGQSHNQNPVQTLKETLDKKKWPQALMQRELWRVPMAIMHPHGRSPSETASPVGSASNLGQGQQWHVPAETRGSCSAICLEHTAAAMPSNLACSFAMSDSYCSVGGV
ncbi:hypothetical protein WJX84_005640 [Apatococcus fuscideae]|uniref:Uncharacterized protein n=1 Tax=Apatococcus fuscideae TaxID=2026836 RepID=A0AAW1SYY7_9CHLO